MKKREIEEQESIKRWLGGVHAYHTGSSETRKNYLKWFKRFIDWLGKTPDQLIEERKQQLKSEDETVKRKAEETLQDFCNWLEQEKGLSRNTSKLYHDAVRSFYRYNYATLQVRTPRRVAVKGVEPHSHEEIRRLYDISGTRDRAVLLCLAESGISRSDFVKLTYAHVKQDYEKESETIHISMVRGKEQINYSTFFGINATKALKAYIEMRKRKGEKISDNSPLFPSKKTSDFLSPISLNLIFKRLTRKSGIQSSPHRLRKFFESNLATKVPSLLVKHWMGHSLGVEKHYFKPSIEEQRKAYLEGYEKIDVLGTTKKPSEESIELQLASMITQMRGKPESEKRDMLANFLKLLTPKTREAVQTKMKSYGIDVILAPPEKQEKEEDCQKVIEESQLEEYLAKGYRFVSVLPSGKVVVED